MKPVYFIHLTDLHIKGTDDAEQKSAAASLLGHLRESLEQSGLLPDFVVISGDVAYSGTASDYARARELIISPLRESIGESVPIVAVPGNHDLDCDECHPIQWSKLGEARQRNFYKEDAQGVKTRAPRARGFAAWEQFCAENDIVSPMPSKNVSIVHEVPTESGVVRLVLTNTSLFSDRDVSDRDAPPPLQSIRAVAGKPAEGEVLALVVGHHPIDYFPLARRRSFESLLADLDATYLHGHTHEVKAEFGPGGSLISLGLSAGYCVGLDDRPTPFYRNGYTLLACDKSLHVAILQWCNESGRWGPASGLSYHFASESPVLRGGFKFPIRTAAGNSTLQRTRSLPQRDAPRLADSILLLKEIAPLKLLSLLRRHQVVPEVPRRADERTVSDSEAEATLEVAVGEARHWVACISASGHVMSKETVEKINTKIDYEQLHSYTVVTVGELGPDGRHSYFRLKELKPIRIVNQADLISRYQDRLDPAVLGHLRKFDAAEARAQLILADEDAYLAVFDRSTTSWFYVLTLTGDVLEESSEVVNLLRRNATAFTFSTYGHSHADQLQLRAQDFDEVSYKEICHREFNSVRYAALATFGLRLSKTTLDDLYVSASANMEDGANYDTALRRAVEEAVQSLRIEDPEMRAQMEGQLRRKFLGERSAESGVARRLYQRYGTVIVLGDPGSGKTLFAKHEILSYAKPTEDEKSWYGRHVPLYMPLSEVARVHDWSTDDIDVLRLAVTMCSRRGLRISEGQVRDLEARGRLAVFFDGLDEVVSLDQRVRIFDAIAEFAKKAKGRGSRVIVTSRPAAVRMLDVPDCLSTISLKGLTTSEMKLLARRILKARISESDVRLDEDSALDDADESLVQSIVSDCAKIPGIGRLARNPLLFTLLTMIYANQGAPAAKRHRVYQQAVQTLVSIRTRSTGQKVFAEADLRRRLGAVALSAYESPRTAVPSWRHVEDTLLRVLRDERGSDVAVDVVQSFIQQVAESTGLLVLHPDRSDSEGGNISFMHQSFMEYYAASGLSERVDVIDYTCTIFRSPRWREVVVLLSGILGDRGGITRLVKSLLACATEAEKLTLDVLLFAFECALESDVPPERTQELLLGAVREAFKSVLMFDDRQRAEVARNLCPLYEASGRESVDEFILGGLRSNSTHEVSAMVDFVGLLSARVEVSPEVVSATLEHVENRENAVRISLCGAISESSRLRKGLGEESVALVLKTAMEGSLPVKYAAVRAAEREPSLARFVWRELVDAIRGPRSYLASQAANAVLRAGWRVASSSLDNKVGGERQDLLTALRVLTNWGDVRQVSGLGRALARGDVEQILSKSYEDGDDRELYLIGIYLLPWVRGEEDFVYEQLMRCISSDSRHDAVSAALDALRMSHDAHPLLKFRNIDTIRSKLKAKSKDVRIAACRLLGSLCSDDDVSAEALAEYAIAHDGHPDELDVALHEVYRINVEGGAIAKSAVFFERKLCKALADRSFNRPKTREVVFSILDALKGTETCLEQRTLKLLRGLFADYRVDEGVAKKVISTFGSVAPLDVEFAEFFVESLRSPPHGREAEVLVAVSDFLGRCGQRVSTIRKIRETLSSFRDLLIARISKLTRRRCTDAVKSEVKNARYALSSIVQMERTYNEVASTPAVSG